MLRNKLFVFVLISLFLISFTSALEIDNVKQYSEELQTVTITNAYGLGDVIGQARLITPHNVRVGAGYQKVAELDLWAYEDYSEAIKEFTFIDMKTGEEVTRDIDIKILKYKEIEVEDFYYNCYNKNDYNNGTYNGTIEVCDKISNGTHIETIEDWQLVTPANIGDGESLRIGIFTEVYINDYIDWIPTIYGVEVEEWATWTADLNTDLVSYWKFDDNYANTTVNDAPSSNDGIASTNTNNLYTASGKINSAFDFDGSSEYVSISNEANFRFDGSTEDFSVNAWIKLDTTGTTKLIFDKRDGAGDGWRFEVEDDYYQ